MKRDTTGLAALVVIGMIVLFGCSSETSYPETAAQPETDAHASKNPVERTAAVEASLMAADQVDGTADHVVSKCSGCSLRMDGSAEHALEVGEYELHFCSTDCKDSFAQDTEASVLALNIPEQ